MKPTFTALFLGISAFSQAAVTITVQPDSGHISISPWIYGRNGIGVSVDSANPSKDSALFLPKEAGLRIARENGGNNCTKYNWRKKMSSHPDWYNNVYAQDWDVSAKEIQSKVPGVQGMYGFQLLGWVASNTNNNFNDYAYNKSNWWSGVGQDLAGGGKIDTAGGSVPLAMGDANKYLQPWPADSTAAILGHWFGSGGVGLDSTRFRYWGMDNEVEIWDGTHNDVDSLLTGHLITAEECVQRWAAVAKAARKLFPGIKLVGPASASEWQWYTWPKNSVVSYKGASYCWPEFLIKRLAEIQDSTGVRMLDVYDVHFYLSGTTESQVMQQHRLLWDTAYLDPNANGVHFADGSYNGNQKHQMFFKRIQDWVDKYFGKGNGITVGATESAIDGSVSNYPSKTATWYASMLGTFADHGAEIFTPWSWYPGMWEVMHLFTHHAQTIRVKSTSSLDSLVSAYSSISAPGDSLTVILVNRDQSGQSVSVNLSGSISSATGTTLQLSNLSGETFVSHAKNALVQGTVAITGGVFSLSLPSYSVTAVKVARKLVNGLAASSPVPARLSLDGTRVTGAPGDRLELLDSKGRILRIGTGEVSLIGLPSGLFVARSHEQSLRLTVP
jgi:hypothetical protein